MTNTEVKSLTIRQAYDAIRHLTKEQGYSLVPLVGAGISSDSGIPTIAPIITYLSRLLWYFEGKRRRHSGVSLDNDFIVSKEGLLDHHSLTETLLIDSDDLGFKTSSPSSDSLILEVITKQGLLLSFANNYFLNHYLHSTSEVIAENQQRLLLSAITDWRKLLRNALNGRHGLLDYFFSQILRNRTPNTAHRSIAFLAKVLDLRLVLTTNFDNLLETALLQEGLESVVYEIMQSGQLPDQSLIRSFRSIIKLHGGAYSLRNDESLDLQMDPASMDIYKKYLPERPLLVVIGYGGGDERVMSLLDELAPFITKPLRSEDDNDADRNTRIIWVHRSSAPPANAISRLTKTGERVRTVQCRSAIGFLHGLYTAIESTTPTSKYRYQLLPPQGPRVRVSIPKENKYPDGPAKRCLVFSSKHRSYFTSSYLSLYSNHLQDEGFTILWYSMSEMTSLHSFVTGILRDIGVHDHHVMPVIVPDSPNLRDVPKIERYAHLIITALRRGKYLLALDSLGELGRDPFSHSVFSIENDLNTLTEERGPFFRFIAKLIESKDKIGESAIALAVTRVVNDDTSPGNLETPSEFMKWCSGRTEVYSCDDQSDPVFPEPSTTTPLSRKELRDQLELYSRFRTDNTFSLEDGHLLILYVASCYRRSRSLSALRTICAQLITSDSFCLNLERIVEMGDLQIPPIYEEGKLSTTLRFCKIDELLDQLDKSFLLTHQDGGFFWMHPYLRHLTYSTCAQEGPSILGHLHHVIASHYYECMYLPSHDIGCFAEYLFHKFLAAKEAANDDLRKKRLHSLEMALDREKQHFLSGRDCYVAHYILQQLMSKLQSHEFERVIDSKEHRSLVLRLRRIMAEALRDGSMYEEASKEYSFLVDRDKSHSEWKIEQLLCQGLSDAMESTDRKEKYAIATRELFQISEPLPDDTIVNASDHESRLRAYFRTFGLKRCKESPWNPQTHEETKSDNSILESFKDAFLLLPSAGSVEARNFYRYSGYLNSYMGREMYLRRNFTDAYHYLEAADASLKACSMLSHNAIIGVQRIFLAECLMLDADCDLVKLVPSSQSTASTKLVRADDALRHAREYLQEGRTYVWWWIYLLRLRAQLCHERMLLECHQKPGLEHLDSFLVESKLQHWMRAGVAQLLSALVVIPSNRLRSHRVMIMGLLLQFKVAWHYIFPTEKHRHKATWRKYIENIDIIGAVAELLKDRYDGFCKQFTNDELATIDQKTRNKNEPKLSEDYFNSDGNPRDMRCNIIIAETRYLKHKAAQELILAQGAD